MQLVATPSAIMLTLSEILLTLSEIIADGVENIVDGIGNQFLPSLAPERSYEISCTSLMKGIFLIFAASLY